MNSDHFVFLLYRSEDKIFLGGTLPPPAPGNLVSLEPIAEIFGVQLVEHHLQVKILAFGGKKELPLDGKLFE